MQENFGINRICRKLSINCRNKSRSRHQGLKPPKEEAHPEENGKSRLKLFEQTFQDIRIRRAMTCRGQSTIQQQKTLHSGWLFKTGVWPKTLKRRWFEIKGDQLYYFKAKGDAKHLSAVLLAGNQVERKTGDAIHPFQFEIISGEQREGRPVTDNRETFVFIASSQEDLEQWIRAINIVIYTPLGGGMFGRSIEDTVRVDLRRGGGMVPILIEKCVEFIRNTDHLEEGIFRLSGNVQDVEDLKNRFNRGEIPDLTSNFNKIGIHTVASLLKTYFRILPEPVIPFKNYGEAVAVANLLKNDQQAGEKMAFQMLQNIPKANFNTLKYICRFLHEFQTHSTVTKMTLENLAVVFGPNFLSPQSEDPQMLMESSHTIAQMMEYFIRNHSLFFPVTEDERYYRPKSPSTTPPRLRKLWSSPSADRDFTDFPGFTPIDNSKEVKKSATFPRLSRVGSTDYTSNNTNLLDGHIEPIGEQDYETQVHDLVSELELQRSQFEEQIKELENKLDVQNKICAMLKIRLHEEHKARSAAEQRLELYRVGIEEYCEKFGNVDISIPKI